MQKSQTKTAFHDLHILHRYELRASYSQKRQCTPKFNPRCLQAEGHTINKTHDVVALGNLCVDVILKYDELPQYIDANSKRRLLQKLTSTQYSQSCLEVGGNCNFMIAALRIGLKVASVGHLGCDVYGEFLKEVLNSEGIEIQIPIVNQRQNGVTDLNEVDQTLLCFVMVNPQRQFLHTFCGVVDGGVSVDGIC
eukprot:TRINITY_DN8040_c0_g1_i8.p1 TRINITY_DN8040_c0_g1~~TRINITY_DN8040_c0_g1_i8.p1  ORF type:complete len:207 (+),score=5.36 TRINITY_DN8040_c0_g1_i8:41-622(+)